EATNWAEYVSIPFYPGEELLVEKATTDLVSVEHAIDGIVELLRNGDRKAALQMVTERALPSIQRSDAAVWRDLELNQHEAHVAGTRITASTRRRGLIAEIIGAFFAVVSAYLGVRVLVQYLAWSAERSADLEQFAGRVAHDIRSPLGSVSLALYIMQANK